MKQLKKRIFEIISVDDGDDIYSAIFDKFIIFLIIINILIIIAESFRGFSNSIVVIFRHIETFSVIVFTIEYLLRIWTAKYLYPNEKTFFKAMMKYIFSFMALIDLFAILPFFIPFIIPVNLISLRMLRIFRILRIFKIHRYTDALKDIGTVIKNKGTQLISSIIVLFILVIMASVIMFNIETEAQPELFKDVFSSYWWTINAITTVGYGDIYPVTIVGKFLSSIISILSVGFVAIPTAIISTGFMEQIERKQLDEINSQIDISTKNFMEHQKIKHSDINYCPYCGKKMDKVEECFDEQSVE